MRWLRRFGERVGAQDTRSSDSARRLYARILTACGLHLTPFRHSSLLLVSNSQGPRSRKPSSEASSSYCQNLPSRHGARQRRCQVFDPSADPVRTARSSLIRRRASLISGFNSLLGHNYFPVPSRREFDCNYLMSLVLSVKIWASEARIDEFPCIFPASREFRGFQRRVRS